MSGTINHEETLLKTTDRCAITKNNIDVNFIEIFRIDFNFLTAFTFLYGGKFTERRNGVASLDKNAIGG